MLVVTIIIVIIVTINLANNTKQIIKHTIKKVLQLIKDLCSFKTGVVSDDNELLTPDILFVPCLAFDNNGYRLGYGGGYYDKTFDYLIKNKKKFISVGYAFEGQKLSSLPIDKYDIKLNYVMTEKNIYSYL